jgi:hypothetical protein
MRTIKEIAEAFKESHPNLTIGYNEESGIVALRQDGIWTAIISKAIDDKFYFTGGNFPKVKGVNLLEGMKFILA